MDSFPPLEQMATDRNIAQIYDDCWKELHMQLVISTDSCSNQLMDIIMGLLYYGQESFSR